MTTSFRNSQLYYETTRAAGRPLILLHGFLESSPIWDQLVENIAAERQVIRLDLPGHGRSESVAEVHSMEVFAEAVNHVLELLQVPKVDLLGHSMGGYVALAFLERFPDKVSSITLLNSTTKPDNEERRENRDRSSDLVRRNKEAFVRMAISNLLSEENNRKFKAELEVLKNRALQFPTDGIVAALQGMKIRPDRTQVLKDFQGKKRLLAGEEDPLLNFNEIKVLALETGSPLHSFPDGHLSYLENSQQFIEAVTE